MAAKKLIIVTVMILTVLGIYNVLLFLKSLPPDNIIYIIVKEMKPTDNWL